jgi:hypothetical protein
MILQMSAAIGTGPTELAAFDDALLKVGAANYNLVRLSSGIPPSEVVIECDGAIASLGGKHAPDGGWMPRERGHQCSRWTTSSKGRRSGLRMGMRGRSAG